MNILIADDRPENLKLLRGVLEAEGHDVREANDGIEALAILNREHMGAIISDILMPRMDGYRLCHEVRQNGRLRGTPFIFYTATYTSPGDEKLCLDLGGDKYLRKPATAREIAAALQEVVHRSSHPPGSAKPPDEIGVMKEYSGWLVSKLQEKNAELTAIEAKFRPLVEQSIVGVYVIENERYTYANPKMCEIFGMSQEELTSRPIYDFIVPEDRPVTRENIRKRMSGIVPDAHYQLGMFHKSGNVLQVEAHGTFTKYDGRDAIIGTVLDISGRKRADDVLKESERRFREMLENVDLIAMTLDTQARVTFCNDYLLRLTGWQREEIAGADWFEKFIPNTRPDVKKLFFDTIEAGQIPSHYENPIKTKTGELREIVWNNTMLRDSAGKIIGTASIGEDVTRRKSLESQFLRTQRMESVGRLASGIAHDLNNFLAPILLSVFVLREKQSPEEKEETLRTIETCTQRGVALIRQLLTFGRGVEGKRGVVQPKFLIQEMIKIIRETFPKNISASQNAPNEGWPVIGDTTQIHQVLLNLCINARDAMPKGGTLTLAAENVEFDEQYAAMNPEAVPGPYVLLRVTDSGEGIPSDVIDKIFDPFFSTKKVGEGTGLGLSTVMGIVRSHGGFLNVHSQPGLGTIFMVYLPATPDAVEAADEPSDVAPPRGQGETILVVDDEAAVRELIQKTLVAHGYRVLAAEGGIEALALYSQHRSEIKVVVTDIMMPLMDGVTLTRILKKIDPSMKVIASSGIGSARRKDDIIAELSSLGIEEFLTKPYTADKVLDAIHQSL